MDCLPITGSSMPGTTHESNCDDHLEDTPDDDEGNKSSGEEAASSWTKSDSPGIGDEADDGDSWTKVDKVDSTFAPEQTPVLSQEVPSPEPEPGKPITMELPSSDSEPEDWDVAKGPWKAHPMERISMFLPAATKMLFGFLGAIIATIGYAAGKVGEAFGQGKAIDSTAFQAGFTAWLWSNGIMPSVKYAELDDAAKAISRVYDFHKPLENEDMALTPVIVSNHTSYLDGIILAALFGAPKIVAMSDARKAPVLGKLMDEMEVVFVDRASGDSRQATLNAISKHTSAWEPGFRPLLMFPEGRISNGEGLLPFKKGAFNNGAPVRPVVIMYTGDYLACTTYRMSEHGKPVTTSDTEWAKQFMGHFVHSVEVHVLPPYVPNDAEKADVNLYAENVRAVMQAELTFMRKI